MKRCPRDGEPIVLTEPNGPRYCLTGGWCGIGLCPLSWHPSSPPPQVAKTAADMANRRKREDGCPMSKWAKRREKIALRRQTADARAAKRAEQKPVVERTEEEEPRSSRPMRLTVLDLVAYALSGRRA